MKALQSQPYFAIYQSKFGPLDKDRLVTVFNRCPQPKFTAYDAMNILNHSFGIILDHLTWEDANRLSTELNREGVACEVGPQSWLSLPSYLPLNRVNPLPEGLHYKDIYEKDHVIPWDTVKVVGIGTFQREESTSESVASLEASYFGHGVRTIFQTVHGIKKTDCVVLDVIAGASATRIRIRPAMMSPEEFRHLVKEISDRSTQSAFSIGTREFAEGANHIPQFPAEKFFSRHLSWLWWNQGGIEKRAQTAKDSPPSQRSDNPDRKFERKLELDGDNPTVISRNPVAAVHGVRVHELRKAMPGTRSGSTPAMPLSEEELHRWKKENLIVGRNRAIMSIILGGVSLVFFGCLFVGLLSGKLTFSGFRLILNFGGLFLMMFYIMRNYW